MRYRFVRRRKFHGEYRALPRLGLGPEFGFEHVGGLSGDGEAQAGAGLTVGIAASEGLEEVGEFVRGDAGTLIVPNIASSVILWKRRDPCEPSPGLSLRGVADPRLG